MPDNVMLLAGIVIGAIVLLVVFRRLGEMRAPTPVQPQSPPSGATPPLVTASGDDATRVAITRPMLRKAAERALKQGGEVTKYLHREGDTIYFSVEALQDPEQRRRALDMLRSTQGADANGDVMDVPEMIELLRQMFGR